MRIRLAGLAVATVALTIPVIAQAATVDKATGGGQIRDDDAPSAALARGNAQVRDGDAAQRRSAAPRTMTFKAALSLAGLR